MDRMEGETTVSNSDSGGFGVVTDDSCTEIAVDEIECDTTDLDKIVISAGDENDQLAVDTSIPTTVFGGDGDDALSGSSHATRLFGGPGADTFTSTGSGATVDYGDRNEPIEITVDGVADDGESGEGDNVDVDSARIVGGSGDDAISGDADANEIDGGSGVDTLDGASGNDTITSNDGFADDVDCGADTDVLNSDAIDADSNCETSTDVTTTEIVAGVGSDEASADPTPTFEFENLGATDFECRVDAGASSPCTSPWTLDELDPGEHSISIEAFSSSTSLDQNPVIREFTFDPSAMSATILAPIDGMTLSPEPIFEFEAEGHTSIDCYIDDEPILDCESPLEPGDPLSTGFHEFRVAVTDHQGFEIESADQIGFNVSDSLPSTEVSGAEDGQGFRPGQLELVFSGATGEGWYECSIDAGEFETCESPWSPEVELGEYDLSVRAVDETGLADSTPWTATVAIDSTLPSVRLTSAPAHAERSENVVFRFSGLLHSGFECRIDAGSFEPCSSPFTPEPLSEGSHELTVRALQDDVPTIARPITAEFIVDSVSPEIVPIWGSEHEVFEEEFSFEFESSEPDSTFECSLVDSYGWSSSELGPCETPFEFLWGDGSYRLSVVAVDQAGNRSTRAFHEFIVARYSSPVSDDIPPLIQVDTVLPQRAGISWAATDSLEVEFSASESATFECAIDFGAYDTCESGVLFENLADGEHTVSICGEDTNSNVGCLVDALTFRVDTDVPDEPTLFSGPKSGEPGDESVFRFGGIRDADRLLVRLDESSWQEASSEYVIRGLAAGLHELEFKAEDDAGNESTVGEHEWSVTAPSYGPHYEISTVSPDPGASYLVWPTPGQLGAIENASEYRVRTCVHARESACEGWSGWDSYEAPEGQSDGLLSSPLTPETEIGTGTELIVTYELEVKSADGSNLATDSYTAGPWPLVVEAGEITDASADDTLDESFVDGEEEVDMDIDVDSSGSGLGIRGIGFVCEGRHFFAGAPSAYEYIYPCASDPVTVPGLNTAAFNLEYPTIVDYVAISCDEVENEMGTLTLDCPKTLSENVGFATDKLLEWADVEPHGRMFAHLANGQAILIGSIDLPQIDKSPPAAPEGIDVIAEPNTSSEPGYINVEWDANGDPYEDDPEMEGSGIDEFEIKYRVNGGSWSDVITRSAHNEWSYSKDMATLAPSDEVEFSIVSIDGVGHRSSESRGSGVAASAEDSVEAASDETLVSGLATDVDSSGAPRLNLYGEWKNPSSTSYDELELVVELFDSEVDKSSPGSPEDTTTEVCGSGAKSCSDVKYLSYAPGSYVTRVTATAKNSSVAVRTWRLWSSAVSVEILDGTLDVPDATDPTPLADPSSATASSGSNYKKGCYRYAEDAFRPSNLLAYTPTQWQCRWALKVRGSKRGKVPKKGDKKKKFKGAPRIEDKGVNDSYAKITDKAKQPISIRPGFRTFWVDGVKKKGWPMFDSLGYTRAWLQYSKTNPNQSWIAYTVPKPEKPNSVTGGQMFNIATRREGKGKARAKLQGRACYRPAKTRGAKKIDPKGIGPRLEAKEVSLFKVDFATMDSRIRLFVENRAFKYTSSRALAKTGISCSHGSSRSTIRMGLQNPNIQGQWDIETSFRDFVFKESRFDPPDLGKTYRTYNAKESLGTMYAGVNTNGVFKGGVVRGAVPFTNTSLNVMGFTGYCDRNAFTKLPDGPDTLPNSSTQETYPDLLVQMGMRWAYGEFIHRKARTGVYGWVPFSGLVGAGGPMLTGSPDSKDAISDCEYGPIH